MQRFTSVVAIVYSACFLRKGGRIRGESDFNGVKSSLSVAKCLLWVFYECGDNYEPIIRHGFALF